MRPTAAFAFICIILIAACDSPPAQPPPEDNLVDATRTDQAYPSGADGIQIITGSGMANTPGPVPGGETPAATGDQQAGSEPENQQGSTP